MARSRKVSRRSRKVSRKISRKSRSRKSRSRKASRKSRSRKSKSPRRSRVHRLTKKQHHEMHLESCRRRSTAENCESDPNCSWNSSNQKCYKGKRLVYQGPALPYAF
jgi:hypothetical protein